MSIVPQRPGGWWHDYVCPTHGIELEPAVGEMFPCSKGCRLSGEPYAAAWTVYEHQGLAREARRLAHASRAGQNPADAERAWQILTEYGRFYAEVVQAGWNSNSESWMLKGKVFSQALSEAQWAVGIADAVIVLSKGSRTTLPNEVAEMLLGLAETMEQARHILVVERDDARSNYTAWLDAAARLVNLALAAWGKAERRDQLLNQAYDHVRLAVRSDGWEWEGSTYYHVFVLRAYLLGLRDVDPATVPSDVAATLGSMLDVLAQIAAPDGFLPALHDGPFDRVAMHREVLEICVLGAQFFSSTGLSTVEGWVRTRLSADHDGLEDLLSGWFPRPVAREGVASASSILFDQVGYVVLRDPAGRLTAVLDAGPHGGAHGHLDTLGLYLYGPDAAWQPAPGVPPYASSLRHGYYARTVAHPTVRVDGHDQNEATATVTRWDPDARRVSAESVEAIDGGTLSRSLMLADGFLIDAVRMQLDDGAEHEITLGLRPAVAFEVRALDGGWTSTWGDPTGDRLVGLHRASTASALGVLPGRGPSVDPSASQLVGEWTAHAPAVDFVSLYCFDQNTAPTAFEIIRSDAAGATLRVHFADSSSTTIEVPR